MSAERLRINEIFHSIQGEGTRAGMPCVFIRLTGCHLRCTYCDTEYAFYEGGWMTLEQIMARVRDYGCGMVEVTGGEPLLQPAVYPLMKRLADEFETVLLETSGAVPIDKVDSRVIRIVDFKCPSSGEVQRNCWHNVGWLRAADEVKFVIGDREDYDWSKSTLNEHDLLSLCPVLFSPVHDELSPTELAEWVLADGLGVRIQLQLHKFIWNPETRGV